MNLRYFGQILPIRREFNGAMSLLTNRIAGYWGRVYTKHYVFARRQSRRSNPGDSVIYGLLRWACKDEPGVVTQSLMDGLLSSMAAATGHKKILRQISIHHAVFRVELTPDLAKEIEARTKNLRRIIARDFAGLIEQR